MVKSSEEIWFRPNSFESELVVLDGMTGTGKTMLMKIIDSFEEVSPPRFDYQLEQLCIATTSGMIEKYAGIQLIQLLIDQIVYDTRISRELNFRLGDLSSVFRSSKSWKYFMRLFQSQDNLQISSNFPVREKNFIVVHQLLDNTNILKKLPKKTIKRIVTVRHPYYLFDHWASYVNKHGFSTSDFTVTIKGNYLHPWFVSDYPEKFDGHSEYDKAAVAIGELIRKQVKFLNQNIDVVVIDFEKFVLNPWGFLSSLQNLIGSATGDIKHKMKSQKLPRKHINDTSRNSVYLRYGSNLLSTQSSHQEDYSKIRSRIAESTSTWHFEFLEEAVKLHEEKFGLWF